MDAVLVPLLVSRHPLCRVSMWSYGETFKAPFIDRSGSWFLVLARSCARSTSLFEKIMSLEEGFAYEWHTVIKGELSHLSICRDSLRNEGFKCLIYRSSLYLKWFCLFPCSPEVPSYPLALNLSVTQAFPYTHAPAHCIPPQHLLLKNH